MNKKVWLENRKESKPRLRWRGRDGKVKSQTVGRSKKAIELARKEILRQLRAGTAPTVRANMTFAELHKALRNNFAPQVSEAYWTTLERRLGMIRRESGPLLAHVTPALIDRLKAELLGRLKTDTVNGYIRSWSAIFAKAVEWGMIEVNPFAKIKALRVPEKDFRILTANEERKLFKHCNTRDYCIVILALYGGLRAKEIANLHVKLDIKRDGKTDSAWVHVRNRGGVTTKSKKQRTVFIGHFNGGMLLDYAAGSKRHFPFFNGDAAAVSRRFYDLKRRAGVPVKLHDLRATCASRLAAKGTPIFALKTFLGHSSVNVTEKHYIKTELDAIRKAGSTLNG